MTKEKHLIIDFETRSMVDIKKEGAYKYAKKAEIISMAYRFTDDPKGAVQVWQPDRDFPKDLQEFTGSIVAHNYKFELYIISECLVKNKLLPDTYKDLDRYKCTMATALRFGLPAKLSLLSERLATKNKKLSEQGERLINRYSKPAIDKKTGKTFFREMPDSDRKLMIAYNVSDVLVTEEIFNILPDLTKDAFEAPIFSLDKEMNFKGFLTDQKSLKKLLTAYETYTKQAEKQAEKLAGRENSGALTVKSSIGFKVWLNDRLPADMIINDCQAFTLETLQVALELRDTPKDQTENIEKIIDTLKIRQVLSATSVKKLLAFDNFSDSKGVIRDSIQYAGAHTLRWAGRGVQPQNFPRVSSEDFLTDIKKLSENKIELTETPAKFKSLLRQLIIPRKGHKFLVGDFSAIESKVLFWLSGCKSGLDVYKSGGDIYSVFSAENIFNIPIDQIDKKKRTLGKVAILGLGYGMGKQRFYDFCVLNKIKIAREFSDSIVDIYRTTYKEISAFWRRLEDLAKYTIQTGKPTEYKDRFGVAGVRFELTSNFLKMLLPSGRYMYYFKPSLVADGRNNRIKFHHNRGVSYVWGGVIVENLIQATSRDLLAVALLECDKKNLNPLLTIHDEIINEVPTKDTKKHLKTFQDILETPPLWAGGLPLGGECVVVDRYCKI